MGLLRRDRCRGLVDLDAQLASRAVGQVPRGVRTIPLAAVVGTLGRCCDFDRCFRPLRPALRRAVAAVRRTFPDGAVPTVELVQLGCEYFVVDGHKRIAAARAAGAAFVDAEVLEVRRPALVAH